MNIADSFCLNKLRTLTQIHKHIHASTEISHRASFFLCYRLLMTIVLYTVRLFNRCNKSTMLTVNYYIYTYIYK